jgi:hypothetical protein
MLHFYKKIELVMFIVFIHKIHEFYFGLIFVRLGVGRESACKGE